MNLRKTWVILINVQGWQKILRGTNQCYTFLRSRWHFYKKTNWSLLGNTAYSVEAGALMSLVKIALSNVCLVGWLGGGVELSVKSTSTNNCLNLPYTDSLNRFKKSTFIQLLIFDLQIYNKFILSVYNQQAFQAKIISTNLQKFVKRNCRFYNKYRAKSTI